MNYEDKTSPDISNSAITNLWHPHQLTPLEWPIYLAYILALLYDVFQIDESRGRLCFQERGDDVDIVASINIKRHIF